MGSIVKHLSAQPEQTRAVEARRRISLDANFDEALARLAVARLSYEDLHTNHGSFAARLDALDRLQQQRTEMAWLLTGLGVKV